MSLWKKLWASKHPDGRPKAGFMWYFLFFGGPLILILIALKGENIVTKARTGRGVAIGRVSQSVQSVEPVQEQAAEGKMKSERNLGAVKELSTAKSPGNDKPVPPPTPEPQNALDMVVADANQPIAKEKPRVVEVNSLPGGTVIEGTEPPGPPEPSADNSDNLFRSGLKGQRTGGGASLAASSGDPASYSSGSPIESLEVYHRKAAQSNDQGASKSEASRKSESSSSKFLPGNFLPRGQYIDLYLLDEARTDQQQPLVTFGVARDVVFNDKVLIRFGTRLLCSIANSEKGTRINFSPSSFQYPDGTELSVSGVIKGIDNAAGLPAYYLPPPTMVQMAPYVTDFMSAYLDIIYQRQQSISSLKIGSVTVGSSTSSTFDPKVESLSVTSDVIRDFAKSQMAELQARYPAYLVAPPGTKARLQLTSPLSITEIGVGVAQSGEKSSGENPGTKSAAESIIQKLPAAASAASAVGNSVTGSVSSSLQKAVNSAGGR